MVMTIIENDKEPIVKQKKTGLVLTVIGGIISFKETRKNFKDHVYE